MDNTTTLRTLDEIRTARDTAIKTLRRWDATVQELQLLLESKDKNWGWVNLISQYANLENANLRSANLENANLENANLYNANLENANLENANLRSANLYNANLYNANLENANLENANLRSANLYNANLRSANLENANLENANLRSANLYNANLRSAIGIYTAYSPNLSSRGAALLGGIVLNDGKVELRFWAGCQAEITAAQLLERVSETHANNSLHAEQYKAAIKFIQACFKSDMKAGKWDYLVSWKTTDKS